MKMRYTFFFPLKKNRNLTKHNEQDQSWEDLEEEDFKLLSGFYFLSTFLFDLFS